MELRNFKLDPSRVNENQQFPAFGLPKLVGHYSLNADVSISCDMSQLKYLCLPSKRNNLFMDLNEGLNSVKRKSKEDEEKGLRDLLFWIMKKKGRIDRREADFVCYRGLLRLIMTTPYETEGWEIMACCVNDIIYLCGRDTEEQKIEKLNITEKQKTFMSWGFKFEQYLLSDQFGTVPDTSLPVDEREEFNCVFTSSLGTLRLLYGAEMDGVDSKEPLNKHDENCLKKAEFIEVKTNRLIQNGRQKHNFERFKLIKWWCQSYLSGVKQIICGFRDDDGIVREIKVFNTQTLHHIAKGKWKPNVCMNFCKDFLAFVKDVVQSEKNKHPGIVWRFIWKPRQPIIVLREENNEEFVVLPKWYLQCQESKE